MKKLRLGDKATTPGRSQTFFNFCQCDSALLSLAALAFFISGNFVGGDDSNDSMQKICSTRSTSNFIHESSTLRYLSILVSSFRLDDKFLSNVRNSHSRSDQGLAINFLERKLEDSSRFNREHKGRLAELQDLRQ